VAETISFDTYLEIQDRNLSEYRQLPAFRIVEAVSSLYQHSLTVVPIDPTVLYLRELLGLDLDRHRRAQAGSK
jgi:hypothetical protein